MESMDIAIAPDGKVAVTVKCVKGKACKDVSAAIEKALGSVVEDTITKEYHEKPTAQHRNQT